MCHSMHMSIIASGLIHISFPSTSRLIHWRLYQHIAYSYQLLQLIKVNSHHLSTHMYHSIEGMRVISACWVLYTYSACAYNHLFSLTKVQPDFGGGRLLCCFTQGFSDYNEIAYYTCRQP